MAIENCTFSGKFNVSSLAANNDDSENTKEFVKKFHDIVNNYDCVTRRIFGSYFGNKSKRNRLRKRKTLIDFILADDSLFESLLSNGGESFMTIRKNDDKIHCWWISNADNTLSSLEPKKDDKNGVTIKKKDYKYFFLFESEVKELYNKLQVLIQQYSNREKAQNDKKTDGEPKKELSLTRYMADSSGCDGKGFSHGFEALLDYQLSWNCRVACYGSTPENKNLEAQCKHILNVLVNPKYDDKKDKSIIDDLENVCVYKQSDKTDLIIELYSKEEHQFIVSGKKYDRLVILVEDKAFTDVTEHQMKDYPVIVRNSYAEDDQWKSTLLLRVVTLQEDMSVQKGLVNQYAKDEGWVVLNDKELLDEKIGKTGNPLFDQFWLEDRCPVDPAEVIIP